MAVFNAEPGRDSGNVVTGRKGASFFVFEVIGKAAHSGARPQDQRDRGDGPQDQALCLTHFEAGTTVNVGLVKGGSSVNTVAPSCTAEVDVRFKTVEAREAAWRSIGRSWGVLSARYGDADRSRPGLSAADDVAGKPPDLRSLRGRLGGSRLDGRR